SQVSSVTMTTHTDNTGYHWQMRTKDQTGRVSSWVAFGNNLDSADYKIAIPEVPFLPTGLQQFQADGSTPIGVGGTVNGTTVVFRGIVSDPDPGDTLKLQVEINYLLGPTTVTSTTGVSSGNSASATFTLVTPATSYW